MRDYQIICPYCFKKFSHEKVHFRVETEFDESELNDEGMTESEIERLPNTNRKTKLMEQTRMRKPFLRKDDEKYMNWWEKFGSTTEKSLGLDRKWIGGVHQLPILDPGDPDAQKFLKKIGISVEEIYEEHDSSEEYFIYDGDGMVCGIEDAFGQQTMRRVCPECHNPLPRQYGKNPVKFISVIGVTGAGKTVYISQLLKYISKYASYLNLDASSTSDHESNFIEDNKVEMDTVLPNSTVAGTFSQPMFYDFISKKRNTLVTNTIVIYDIAGEDCQTAANMEKYGDYINYSDGIILLVDPGQLKWVDRQVPTEPKAVLNTIYVATKNAVTSISETPIAVCVSKSDTFEEMIPAGKRDIVCAKAPVMETKIPVFNAVDYNELEKQLCEAMSDELAVALENKYKFYNYFAFSAIGGPVREEPARTESGEIIRTKDGKEKMVSYPIAPPVPRRIAEPLFWLFYRFGFIKSDIPIRLPMPREMPSKIEIPAKGLKAKLGIGKPSYRPLTDEEKRSYWYEAGF